MSTAPPFTPPRIGGGTSPDTAWVGGSNLPAFRSTRARSIHARRPEDFRSAEKVKTQCTKGLPDSHKLGLEEEKQFTTTFTTWISAIREIMEERGMDTVFRPYSTKENLEVYLLVDWGKAKQKPVKDWVESLKTGLEDPTDPTLLLPACPYDHDNLSWSEKAVRDSISMALWSTIEKDLTFGASGPEVFAAIIDKVQQVSASAVRSLTNDLEELTITKVPRQDVDVFSSTVSELARRIEGSGAAPADLSVLVAKCFLNSDVKAFDLEALRLYNEVDDNANSHTWNELVSTLKSKYRKLVGNKLWTPKATTKKTVEQELNAMKQTVHNLVQRSNGNNNNNSNNNKSGGGRDLSQVVCHGCGKKGHYKNNCPESNSSSNNSNSSSSNSNGSSNNTTGKWKAPAKGESEIRMIDGTEHKYCKKCRGGQGFWTRGKNAHVTSQHKTKEELQEQKNGNSSNNGGASGNALAPTASETPRSPEGGLRLIGGSLCCAVASQASEIKDRAPKEQFDFPEHVSSWIRGEEPPEPEINLQSIAEGQPTFQPITEAQPTLESIHEEQQTPSEDVQSLKVSTRQI